MGKNFIRDELREVLMPVLTGLILAAIVAIFSTLYHYRITLDKLEVILIEYDKDIAELKEEVQVWEERHFKKLEGKG